MIYKHDGTAYEPPKDSKWNGSIGAAAVCGLLLIAALTLSLTRHSQDKQAKAAAESMVIEAHQYHFVTVTNPNVDQQPPLPVTNPATLNILKKALGLWQRSLGHAIKKPMLLSANARLCGSPYALACADEQTGTIYLIDENLTGDKMLSVLLHEIGHLLGVPHIEGDSLMDPPQHEIPATRPSRFAIALAKAARR